MTIKRQIRRGIDWAAASMGVFAGLQRRMCRGLTVLMYHRVLPDHRCVDYPHASLVMPVSAFREQVRWLADHCRVMTVRDGVDWLKQGRPSDRPVVCISFDDGYDDNCEHAAPVLEAAGVRGSFYVTVDYIGARNLLWFDRAAVIWLHTPPARLRRLAGELLNERAEAACASFDAWIAMLKECDPAARMHVLDACDIAPLPTEIADEYRMMTVDQVRALHRAGHEIGSHTLSHPMLTQLDADQMTHELSTSRRTIETWINHEVTGLAYPDGNCDRSVARCTRELGYAYALTTMSGLSVPGDDLYHLYRIDMNPSRVLGDRLRHDTIGFRSELTRFREALRQVLSRRRHVAAM